MVTSPTTPGANSGNEPFAVFPFSTDTLYSLIGKQPSFSQDLTEDRVRYFNKYLTDLNAQTVVIEYEYVDGDYLDDYATYYVKCFHDYDRRCNRLHFFATAFTFNDFLSIVRDNDLEKLDTLKAFYLGFIVIRPLPEATVGRTVLKTYQSDDGRRHFPCIREYHANLFGIDLPLKSLAYQEQDAILAACATVSLWCCFNKTRDLFGSASPTPAEITSAATNIIYFSRSTPSAGLKVQQICSAIKHVGLEPEVLPVKKETPLISLVYAYVRLGLPVILGVEIDGRGPHAITVTGYSLTAQNKRATEFGVISSKNNLPTAASWIDRLYCHDDQIGPFSRVWVRPPNNELVPLTFEGSWRDPVTSKPLAMSPLVVIIPVYHKIRVTFVDIHKWLMRIHAVFKRMVQENSRLEWEVYLTTNNDYKADLRRSRSFPNDLVAAICLAQHPRFIWRVICRSGDQPLLELLVDATGIATAVPVYQATWSDTDFRNKLKELLDDPELVESGVTMLKLPLWSSMKRWSAENFVFISPHDKS